MGGRSDSVHDFPTSVFWEDGRSRESFFVAGIEQVFLARHLHLRPAFWADTDDSSRANAFDDQVGLKTDLDAAAAQRNVSNGLVDFKDLSTGRHVGGPVVAGCVFQGVHGSIHLCSDALLEVGVERGLHAAEQRRGDGRPAELVILDGIDLGRHDQPRKRTFVCCGPGFQYTNISVFSLRSRRCTKVSCEIKGFDAMSFHRLIQRFSFRLMTLSLGLLACAGDFAWSQTDQFPWKAGVARTIITPETGVWLAGYGTKRAPEGKLHDLWMKCVALEDSQGDLAVLITSDFQGVPKSMSDRVFGQLKTKYALDRHQVMFTFSHNHCGPRLGDDLIDYYPVDAEQEKLVADYTDLMVESCVNLVGEALARRAPARLQTGQGVATFAVNRRNNAEAEVAELLAKGIALKGPVDHSVPILTVTRPGGQLEAIVFGYACHPTTLSFTTWCGDYPGFAQLVLEAKFPGATAMFVNTCGGDQNPLPRRSVELCEQYGQRLAHAVLEALQPAVPLEPLSAELQMVFSYVDLPYLNVVSRDELATLLSDSNAIRARWADRMLQKLDGGHVFETSYPYPLHVWRLGESTLMIGMGAETVVDYALRFKGEYGPQTWVCGYTDDMISYIPSRRVWEEGGYEGGSNLFEYGRPAFRWSGDIEQRIVGEIHRLVDELDKPH